MSSRLVLSSVKYRILARFTQPEAGRELTLPSAARTIFIKGALFGTDRDDGGGASRDGCGATAHAMNSLRILSGREGERAESLSVERRKKERKTEG